MNLLCAKCSRVLPRSGERGYSDTRRTPSRSRLHQAGRNRSNSARPSHRERIPSACRTALNQSGRQRPDAEHMPGDARQQPQILTPCHVEKPTRGNSRSHTEAEHTEERGPARLEAVVNAPVVEQLFSVTVRRGILGMGHMHAPQTERDNVWRNVARQRRANQ